VRLRQRLGERVPLSYAAYADRPLAPFSFEVDVPPWALAVPARTRPAAWQLEASRREMDELVAAGARV
jgi:hypothetical protein